MNGLADAREPLFGFPRDKLLVSSVMDLNIQEGNEELVLVHFYTIMRSLLLHDNLLHICS